MPLFDYQCESCGYKEEVLQSIKEEPLKECPKCKKQTFKKLISPSSFILKGKGFYKTDYKNEN